MNGLAALAPAFGLMGLFASRVFLPAFAAALMLRLGPGIGWMQDLGLMATIGEGAPPTWFTADLTLHALGVLALVELIAHKSPGAREFLVNVDQLGKPVAAALTYIGILSVRDHAFIEGLMAQAGIGTYGFALVVAGGTFVVARAHNAVVAGVIEMDEDDDTGVVGYFSWVQDLWSLFGVFLLLLFPIAVLVLIGIGIGGIFLLRKRAEAKEEQARIACPSCARLMYRSAIACPSCGNANPAPTAVNWLGASTGIPVGNLQRHALDLVAKKRCRNCASRLVKRSPSQSCPACGAEPFDDPAFLAAYDGLVNGRLSSVLVACFFLSLVPVIGLIVGVIYYRMALVAPFRRYVGRGRAFFLRLAVKVLFFFLILLQLVPMLGAIVVPTMAWISYGVYRRAFFGMARRTLAPVPA